MKEKVRAVVGCQELERCSFLLGEQLKL